MRVILYGRSKGLFMELKTLTIDNAHMVKPLYIILVCAVFLQISSIVSGPIKTVHINSA
jgi:hypothetical protein